MNSPGNSSIRFKLFIRLLLISAAAFAFGLFFSVPLDLTKRMVIGLVILAVFLSVFNIAASYANHLTRALLSLLEKIQNIPENDPNSKISLEDGNEFGDLACAFNEIMDKLRKSHQELAQKVNLGQSQQSHSQELVTKMEEMQKQNVILEATKKEMGNLMANMKTSESIAQLDKARNEALLESIGDGMVATDSEMKVSIVNHSAQNLLGWSVSEMVGKKFGEIIPVVNAKGDFIDRDRQPIAQALSTGQKVTSSMTGNVLYYVRRDGNKFPVLVTATPVINRGNVTGAIIIFRDITHETDVDRMKTEFISLASHQLRTPLSAIKWFSEMLSNGDAGKLAPEQMEFVTNIVVSTQRMIELVNGLLDISRIESGRIMVAPEPTDLKKLIDGIVKELTPKTMEKKQTLAVSVHSDLPLINLDPKLIRQVYMNLLTNAVKYTPAGGEISIFVSRQGEELISEVSDNGYGIPKEQQNKIFEKFFRANNIIKVETEGTGLGLYLVKAIIESSRGRVWFESEKGKGSTFWFSLPISGMTAKKGEVTLE